MRLVAIYLRNSDPRQAAQGTQDGQLAEAQAKALQLGAAVYGIYTDAGKSAKTGALRHRGDFARLVDDARAKRFDAVIVANIDRLTRTESFAELGAIYGPLQDAGVTLVTTGGQTYDLGAPDGQLLAYFESWRAARENAARRERTIRGRRDATRKGRPSGPPPWGLLYDREASAWRIDEPIAELVREMYRRVAAGESTETLSVDMERRGVRRARSTKWDRERIYALVTSTAYRGEWVALKGMTPIKVPAIVDEDLWCRAREVLAGAARYRGLRRTRHVYLLEAIAVCGICGTRILIKTSTDYSGGPTYRYYICGNRRRAAYGERCDLPLYRVETTDERVWASVLQLADPSIVAEAIAGQGDEAAAWRRDLEQAEQRLRHLEDVETGVLRRYRRGLVSERAFDAELERNQRERQLLQHQIAAARQQSTAARADAVDLATAADALRDRVALAGSEPVRRREIVHQLIPGRGGAVATLGADGSIRLAYLVPTDAGALSLHAVA